MQSLAPNLLNAFFFLHLNLKLLKALWESKVFFWAPNRHFLSFTLTSIFRLARHSKHFKIQVGTQRAAKKLFLKYAWMCPKMQKISIEKWLVEVNFTVVFPLLQFLCSSAVAWFIWGTCRLGIFEVTTKSRSLEMYLSSTKITTIIKSRTIILTFVNLNKDILEY